MVKMVSSLTLAKSLPALAAGAFAAASYPPIPVDLTTPVQQRIAVNGPNSMSIYMTSAMQNTFPGMLILDNRCFDWVEYLSATQPALCFLWQLCYLSDTTSMFSKFCYIPDLTYMVKFSDSQ